jgi:hypothetical protein
MNRGKGAGGSNTNYYGKKFEDKTNNEVRLLDFGYVKKYINKKYYLIKEDETPCDTLRVYTSQANFKSYMAFKYDIEVFRCPDEAYIIDNLNKNNKKIVKILEKKEQNVSGSVETKLWASPSLKREYEIVLGADFEVHYCLCVSTYLQKLFQSDNKKYKILLEILKESNIRVLFGDDEDYFKTLDDWLESS